MRQISLFFGSEPCWGRLQNWGHEFLSPRGVPLQDKFLATPICVKKARVTNAELVNKSFIIQIRSNALCDDNDGLMMMMMMTYRCVDWDCQNTDVLAASCKSNTVRAYPQHGAAQNFYHMQTVISCSNCDAESLLSVVSASCKREKKHRRNILNATNVNWSYTVHCINLSHITIHDKFRAYLGGLTPPPLLEVNFFGDTCKVTINDK